MVNEYDAACTLELIKSGSADKLIFIYLYLCIFVSCIIFIAYVIGSEWRKEMPFQSIYNILINPAKMQLLELVTFNQKQLKMTLADESKQKAPFSTQKRRYFMSS